MKTAGNLSVGLPDNRINKLARGSESVLIGIQDLSLCLRSFNTTCQSAGCGAYWLSDSVGIKQTCWTGFRTNQGVRVCLSSYWTVLKKHPHSHIYSTYSVRGLLARGYINQLWNYRQPGLGSKGGIINTMQSVPWAVRKPDESLEQGLNQPASLWCIS